MICPCICLAVALVQCNPIAGESQSRSTPSGIAQLPGLDPLEVLFDETNQMDPGSVLAASGSFTRMDSPLSLGFYPGTAWVKIPFEQATPGARYIIENPVAYVERVDFFLLENGVVTSHQTAGSTVSSSLPLPTAAFLFAPRSVTSVILLRYTTEGSLFIEPHVYAQRDYFLSHQNFRTAQGAYFGIALLMAFLTFAAYVRRRNPVFLLYLTYIVVVSLYQLAYTGLAKVYLWPNQIGWNRVSLVVLGNLAFISILLFSSRFFLIAFRAPRLRLAVNVLIALLALLGVSVTFLPISVVDPATHALTAFSSFFLLGIAVYFWIKGLTIARFYVLGLIFLLGCVVAFNLFATGILDFPPARHAIQFGSLVEMAVFNVALLDKVRATRDIEDASLRPELEDSETPRVHPGRMAEIVSDLSKMMTQEKVFCDEDLNLQRLSGMLNVRPDQLSYIINKQYSKHFNTFINEYRIEEAKKRLREEPGVSVLRIAFDVGFNSKSAFYRAFQNATGMQPSNYRETLARSGRSGSHAEPPG